MSARRLFQLLRGECQRGVRTHQPVIQIAALEVMPEPGQLRATRLKFCDELLGIIELDLGGAQRGLGGLPPRELRPVEFDEQGPPFALVLLCRQLRGELFQDLTAPAATWHAAGRTPAPGNAVSVSPSRVSSDPSISCTRAVAPSCCLMRSCRR